MSDEKTDLIAEIKALIDEQPPREQWAFVEILKIMRDHKDGLKWAEEGAAKFKGSGKYCDLLDYMIERRREQD